VLGVLDGDHGAAGALLVKDLAPRVLDDKVLAVRVDGDLVIPAGAPVNDDIVIAGGYIIGYRVIPSTAVNSYDIVAREVDPILWTTKRGN
jgi:hypothetical protein